MKEEIRILIVAAFSGSFVYLSIKTAWNGLGLVSKPLPKAQYRAIVKSARHAICFGLAGAAIGFAVFVAFIVFVT